MMMMMNIMMRMIISVEEDDIPGRGYTFLKVTYLGDNDLMRPYLFESDALPG